MNSAEKLVITSSGMYGDDRHPLLVVDNWDGTEEQVQLIMAWYVAKNPGYKMYDLDYAIVDYVSFATTPDEMDGFDGEAARMGTLGPECGL